MAPVFGIIDPESRVWLMRGVMIAFGSGERKHRIEFLNSH